MPTNFTATDEGDVLVLRIQKNVKGTISKTGKMHLIASSHGWEALGINTAEGKPLAISLNLGYKN